MGAKGWRLSSAAKLAAAKSGECCHCRAADSCEHWRDLNRYAAELSSCAAAARQADRVATLKSLAALLLCLASDNPSTAAGDDYALSVPVGSAAVTVAHDDVVSLSRLLFQELGKISGYLLYVPENQCSPAAAACGGEAAAAAAVAAAVHLEAFAQTLCCCIRIIPVVDMFNTSMSHTAASTVHEMLRNLCSASKFFPLGSPYTVREHQDVVLRSSLLEVFLDEILLNRALTFPDGESFSYRASIEAAFAHMIHYEFLQARSDQPAYSKLSLPAGVLLLDMTTSNRVSSELLTHIISLVTGALIPGTDPALCELDLHPGSIQAQTYIPQRFQIDDDLSHGAAIGLAASVIETAMGLLSKYYSASVSRDQAGFDWIGIGIGIGLLGGEQSEYSSMLASLLRAVSCATNRLVGEICSMKQNRDRDGIWSISIERAFDTVAASIGSNMPSTKFMQAIGCFEQEMIEALTSERRRETIGWALVIFAHIFCYESQRGLDEAVAIEYLRLLDSILALLLLESRSDDDGSIPASTNLFLHRMIKSLQRTAWDMCSRKQKSTAKLMSFISKVSPLRLPTIDKVKVSNSDPGGFPAIKIKASTSDIIDPPEINCATPAISVNAEADYARTENLETGSSDLRFGSGNDLPTCRFSFQADHEEVEEFVEEIVMDEASDLTAPPRPRPSTLVIAKQFMLKRKHRVETIAETKPDVVEVPIQLDTEVKRVTKRRRRRGSKARESSEACIGKRTRGAIKKTTTSTGKRPKTEAETESENPYIDLMLTTETSQESFRDLDDFIVCKKGRNYSKFLNSRIKFRRKTHTRMIWQRRDEKQSLMRMLEIWERRV